MGLSGCVLRCQLLSVVLVQHLPTVLFSLYRLLPVQMSTGVLCTTGPWLCLSGCCVLLSCSNGPEALKKYEGDKDIIEAAMEAGDIIQQMQQEQASRQGCQRLLLLQGMHSTLHCSAAGRA